MYDFKCTSCEHRFDRVVDRDDTTAECPECGDTADKVMSAPRIGRYNDPAVKSAALRKRSYEHSMREAAKEPERIAKKLGVEPKVQNRWNLRSTKSSK